MVRWDQGLKSAQQPVPGENWDRAAKTETSGNVGFHSWDGCSCVRWNQLKVLEKHKNCGLFLCNAPAMVGRGGKLNAVRKMSEIKLEEATSPSYPTLKAGSVWIVIKSRKVQLNRSKEDGGCREKTQWEGAAEIEESTVRGKGLLCFLPRRSNNIFWSPALCASLLCRCQNTHNSQGCVPAKHANSLPTDPLPHPLCPST